MSLTDDYWAWADDDPAPKFDLDRERIAHFNSFLAPKLRRILEANDLGDRRDILLAIDPSAGFRAFSMPLPTGFLIAHSVRFAMATSTVCTALAATMPAESGGRELTPLVDDTLASEMIQEALHAARDRQDVPGVQMPPGRRADFATRMTEDVLAYVTCHELAHVLLGHFEGADPAAAHPIDLAGWAREMSADQRGFELFVRLDGYPRDRWTAYLGPAVFFEMAEWVHGVRLPEAVSATPLSELVRRFREHPPANGRLSALIRTNHPDSIAADLGEIEHMSRLMAAARGASVGTPAPDVVAALERLQADHPPGDLDRLFNTAGADASGLTAVGVGPILDRVRTDRRWVEAALAEVALAVLRLGRAQGAPARHHLGLLYNLYAGLHLADESADRTVVDLLRAAVPDLDLIALEQAAMSWGQLE